jgi:hypothetical protein
MCRIQESIAHLTYARDLTGIKKFSTSLHALLDTIAERRGVLATS